MGKGEIPMGRTSRRPSGLSVCGSRKRAPRRTLLSYNSPKLTARFAPSVDEWGFMMDKQLETLLYQQWSNNACRGYVIWAMGNCGYSPDDIQRVISELHYVFDMKSIEEADRHYCDSPY